MTEYRDSKDMDKIRLPKAWSDWKITSLIGKGAYANVYRAVNTDGDVCAIKILSLPKNADTTETDLLGRFSGTRGIVEIMDYVIEQEGTLRDSATLFIRMECLTDLRRWPAVTEEEAVRMMLDLSEALESLEAEGILHRDIKPENILITSEGRAKLCDFGVARILTQTDPSLTLQGTFAYMAPEVWHGENYDHRADLYSLGMVFYKLMNKGKLPFEESCPGGDGLSLGKTREDILKKRMSGAKFPAPAAASPGFAQILMKLCAYHPYNRYLNARELKKDLLKLKNGSLRLKKKPVLFWECMSRARRAACCLLLLLLLAAGSFGIYSYMPLVWNEPCGEGVSWTLRRNGTLTVSGQGVMMVHMETEKMMIGSYLSQVKKLAVKKGVHSISMSAGIFPNLVEVSLPDGLRKLDSGTFSGCQKISRLKIPDSVTYIGEFCFSDCPRLREVELPDGLGSLPYGLFMSCPKLKTIDIPDSVAAIDSHVFDETLWLEERRKEQGNIMVNDILLLYREQEENIHLTKEMGIGAIAPYAFSESSVKKISIAPDVLRSIGTSAFEGTGITELILPEGLPEIPAGLCSECKNLRTIKIPGSAERIGQFAFRGCTSLKEVSIPESVSYIGWQAFDGTPFYEQGKKGEYVIIHGVLLEYTGAKENLEIPTDLEITGIGDYVFEHNLNLKSVRIPEGVTWIGRECFLLSENLEEINLPESLATVELFAFNGTKWWKEQCETRDYVTAGNILLGIGRAGKDTEEIEIPQDLPVTKMMGNSLSDLSDLHKITIPDQIRVIDTEVFDNCWQITDVELPDTFSEEDITRIFSDTSWYYIRE